MSACRFCDRTADEVAACPSAFSTACSSAAFNKAIASITRLSDRLAASGNYVANKESDPTEALFANGRTVKVVRGKLVIGWDRKRAKLTFPPKGSDIA